MKLLAYASAQEISEELTKRKTPYVLLCNEDDKFLARSNLQGEDIRKWLEGALKYFNELPEYRKV